MGTILERRRKDGSVAYNAFARVMKNGKRHTETATFERRAAAQAWIDQREKKLENPNNFAAAVLSSVSEKNTVRAAIDKYLQDHERQMGKTKAQVLRSLKEDQIADMACSDVNSVVIVDLMTRLGSENRKPQTVLNYISHLRAVFSIAKAAWGFDIDPTAMDSATLVGKKLGKIAKSAERDRRPTIAEMNKLMEYFWVRTRKRNGNNPMELICLFAMFSTRRQEEITTLRWDDYEERHKRIMVRDMKNPGEKFGNNVWCELPDPCTQIISSMERTGDRLFPYNVDAISAAFTRACKFLGIVDLHFHDLRHEGISRLFEMGYTIPLAASVSGHRSWNSLKRYTSIRGRGDKWDKWEWIDRIAPVNPTSP